MRRFRTWFSDGAGSISGRRVVLVGFPFWVYDEQDTAMPGFVLALLMLAAGVDYYQSDQDSHSKSGDKSKTKTESEADRIADEILKETKEIGVVPKCTTRFILR